MFSLRAQPRSPDVPLIPDCAGHKAKPAAPCPALCVEKEAWGGGSGILLRRPLSVDIVCH